MDKYLGLIRKIVWSFHRSTGIDWDELFSEATVGFYEQMPQYEHTRGHEVSTFLYRSITNKLNSFVRDELKNKYVVIDETWPEIKLTQTPFFELFDSLSPDSKIIAEMVLNNPHKYLALPSRLARGLIVNDLLKDKKWSWNRIWAGLRAIKLELTIN